MINSRIGQDSKWLSHIWKLYGRGSKDFLYLIIKPTPTHHKTGHYKDTAHNGPNIWQMFVYVNTRKMPITYQESSF